MVCRLAKCNDEINDKNTEAFICYKEIYHKKNQRQDNAAD